MTILGSDNYRYEEVSDWPQLPYEFDLGEVSWTAYGRLLDPPRKVKSFRKLVKI